jgi:hypothetical protein
MKVKKKQARSSEMLDTYEDIIKASIKERKEAIIEDLMNCKTLEQASETLKCSAVSCVRQGEITEDAKALAARYDGILDMRNACIQIVGAYLQEKPDE